MDNITLHQSAEDVRELLEQVDPETGELPAEFEKAQALVARKSQASAAWILSNEAEADFVEEHAKKLLEKVKQARKRSEYLRLYLAHHMRLGGITEIKSEDGTFKAKLEVGRDESVDVFNAADLPSDYMRVSTSYAPDKKAISAAIKGGVEIPGARIVVKDRLTIK